MHKDLLTIMELSHEDFEEIMDLSFALKKNRESCLRDAIQGKSVGLIFSKSSTRTRVSFEVGIAELGGNTIYLDQSKLQIGRGESIPDTARVLSRYLHAVVIRTDIHENIVELAKFAGIPVINALTDDYHPCQTLTDLFTIKENSGGFDGVKLAFLGDGESNMANSLILAAKFAGIDLKIAAPEKFKPSEKLMNYQIGDGTVQWYEDPDEAVEDADYVYTDVWISMGNESESGERLKVFRPYQLTMDLLSKASDGVKVMHCLPAHRGEEITAEVMESHNSIVFEQAENRLHVQKAVLIKMIGEEKYAEFRNER